MFLRGRFLCVVLFCSSVASLHSQTAAPDAHAVPTIKAKARLVVVDVVVTNEKGEAVTGLHQGDFEIQEEGKPQTISTFEEHHGAPITQLTLPPMPRNVYTNFPVTKTADSVNVLLLDALNTPSLDQVYVHSQMIKYLKTIPPGTRVAIFTLASRLRMLQGITTDSTELLAVLNSDKAGPRPSLVLPSDVEKSADQRRIDFMTENEGAPAPQDQTLAQAAVDPINATKQFLNDASVFQTEQRMGITLEALQQLARYLAGVPGRKNVIWFSGAFPAGIVPDPDLPDSFSTASNFQQDIRKTADLLCAGQVALYPIAAEGLAADTAFQVNGQEISQKRGSIAMQDQVRQLRTGSVDRDSNHAAMEQLAQDTGGKAFYNTNGLNDALARVINSGTRYYSLTYVPTNGTTDGKFRRIQVKLVKGKDTLAYRRGYYADDLQSVLSAGQKPDSDPLLTLMGRNLPDFTQIMYKVRVLPSDPQPLSDAPRIGSNTQLKGPFTRYGVDFAISTQDLKIDANPDGTHHGSIEVALVAYDRQGKPLNFVVTQGDLLVKPDVYAGLQKVGVQMHKEIDVPKEYVYLRTGVYDLRSGTVGTLGIPLTDASPSAAK